MQRKSVAAVDKSPDAPVRVRIELQDEVMGQVRVLVANDRLPTPGAHAAPIPVVETGRTSRQYVALKSAGRDEVSVSSAAGLEPLTRNQGQWRELTAALGADVTLAYMVAAGGQAPRLEFNTVRREDVQVAGASIGLAETNLVLDADGAYRAAATFHTNNATEQFLDVELPPGAVLWTAVVAGEPVKPIDPPGAKSGPGPGSRPHPAGEDGGGGPRLRRRAEIRREDGSAGLDRRGQLPVGAHEEHPRRAKRRQVAPAEGPLLV